MAGRGTDILLGGNPDFLSKEILRKKGLDPADRPAGRAAGAWPRRGASPSRSTSAWSTAAACTSSAPSATSRAASTTSSAAAPGRQGDPGSSRFYLSLEDDLLRIFGSQRIQRIMERLGMEEGEPIEHKLVTRAIATAQKRVETHNFEIRKHLLEYDDVMNKQREIVYGMRRQILDGESQAETRRRVDRDLAGATLERYAAGRRPPRGLGPAPGSTRRCTGSSTCGSPAARRSARSARARPSRSWSRPPSSARYREREAELGADLFHRLERWIMLGLGWRTASSAASISSGRTTCCPWTTSRKASGCAATASATR